MENFWDQRFKGEEYHYGTAPNAFFEEQLKSIPAQGKALFPAEGEGRNAVFAAGLGWEVTAFDSSVEGRKKALHLAQNKGVEISYLHQSYDSFEAAPESFDLIVLIYAHHPQRAEVHQKLLRYLKPGGWLLLEGFSKEQIHRNSGGPKNIDMLFSEEELRADFAHMKELNIEKQIIHLHEGEHHKGEASVMRVLGRK
jgi:SAM-dependent methyltransferase